MTNNDLKKAMKIYVQNNPDVTDEDFAYFLHENGADKMFKEQSMQWFKNLSCLADRTLSVEALLKKRRAVTTIKT